MSGLSRQRHGLLGPGSLGEVSGRMPMCDDVGHVAGNEMPVDAVGDVQKQPALGDLR